MSGTFTQQLYDRLTESEKRRLAEGRPLRRETPTAAGPAARPLPIAARGPSEILFEFIPQGSYVKVNAVDPESGIEVTVVGAATASQQALEALAARKLIYVLEKRSRR